MVALLIVDDEEHVKRMLARRMLGFETILTAVSHKEAVRYVARDELDAAIIDVGLPDGCGLDVARVFRARNKRAPILLFTGDPYAKECVDAHYDLDAALLGKNVAMEKDETGVDRLEKWRLSALRRTDPGHAVRTVIDALPKRTPFTPAHRSLTNLIVGGVPRADLAAARERSENTITAQLTSILENTRMQSVDELRCTTMRALTPFQPERWHSALTRMGLRCAK